MKPTPRKLVLAMSIAGLGASIGGAVHAKSDAGASSVHAGLAVAVGLPLPRVGDAPLAASQVRVEGFPQTLALPLDGALAAVDEDIPAMGGRRLACAPTGVGAGAAPRSLWGARRAVLRAPAHARPEANTAAAAEVVSACSTAPVRDDPTRHRVVDGVGIRPPKAPPVKRSWETLGTAGDDPDADPRSRGRSTAEGGLDAATAAQRVLEALAQHRSGTASGGALPQLDIDLASPHDAGAAPRTRPGTAPDDATRIVDLYFDIDPVTEPGTVAATDTGSASTTSGVDIALDLDLDFYLRSIAASDSDAPFTAAPAPDRDVHSGSSAAEDRPATGAATQAGSAVTGLDLELDLLPPAGIGVLHVSVDAAAAAPARTDAVGDVPASRIDAPTTVTERSATAADAPPVSTPAALALALDLDLDQPAVSDADASTALVDLHLDLPAISSTASLDLDLDLSLDALKPAVARRDHERGPDADRRSDAGVLDPGNFRRSMPDLAATAASSRAGTTLVPVTAVDGPPVATAVDALSGGIVERPATTVVARDTAFDAHEDDTTPSHTNAAVHVLPSAMAGGIPPALSDGTASTVPDSADRLSGTRPVASGAAFAAQLPAVPPHSDVAAVLSGAVADDLATPATHPQQVLLGEMVALGEGRLDEVRGGFQTSDGLHISLGIERAVYINGTLVTTSNLNVVGRGAGTAVQTGSVPEAGSTGLTLIQQGSGNTFLPGLISPTAAGTVIQNTLDGQTIRSITSINATVNSLEIMRARSFESSMRGAIVDSLRR